LAKEQDGGVGQDKKGRKVALAYWFQKKPKLASITLKPPGLVELLIGRTFLVNPFSTVFHLGMVVALLTGILMEIMYFTGFSTVLQGWGWTVTWIHGLFGLATAIGFVGVLVRFARNRLFRLASGNMFYVDAAFIVIISVSGFVLLLEILGVSPAASGWWTTIHLTSVIAWLIISLFTGGLVAHAVATVVYRFTNSRSPAAFQAFNSACGRCGRCVEVCPQYEASNERPEDAPALKVRRYLNVFRKGASLKELKAMAEDVYVCALCGLCVGVCPYSFRHYDLYMSLLTQVNWAMGERSGSSR
jgi:ferredoxin